MTPAILGPRLHSIDLIAFVVDAIGEDLAYLSSFLLSLGGTDV